MSAAVAVGVVVRCCDDAGLRDLGRLLSNAVMVFRQRDLLMQVLHAARAVRESAVHFQARPIEEAAVGLERAAAHALELVDVEVAALWAAQSPLAHHTPLTYPEWMAKAGGTPPGQR